MISVHNVPYVLKCIMHIFPEAPVLNRRVSSICRPSLSLGSKAVIGFCGIKPKVVPHSSRRFRGDRAHSDCPSTWIVPPLTWQPPLKMPSRALSSVSCLPRFARSGPQPLRSRFEKRSASKAGRRSGLLQISFVPQA